MYDPNNRIEPWKLNSVNDFPLFFILHSHLNRLELNTFFFWVKPWMNNCPGCVCGMHAFIFYFLLYFLFFSLSISFQIFFSRSNHSKYQTRAYTHTHNRLYISCTVLYMLDWPTGPMDQHHHRTLINPVQSIRIRSILTNMCAHMHTCPIQFDLICCFFCLFRDLSFGFSPHSFSILWSNIFSFFTMNTKSFI